MTDYQPMMDATDGVPVDYVTFRVTRDSAPQS